MISRYVARWSLPASCLSRRTEAELASAYADLKRVVIHVADRTANGVGKLYTSAQPG
jgi:hypothetical protein